VELVEGKTVSGPLPLDTARTYARQIAVHATTLQVRGSRKAQDERGCGNLLEPPH
jgi:hypothetical protein